MQGILHAVRTAVFGLVTLSAFGPLTHADVMAVDFTAPVSFSTFGNYSLGWRFETVQAITVDALGYYNTGSDNHAVGIYQQGNTTALVSDVVSPADTLVGQWRFHTLSTPLTLTAGTEYFIMGVSASENYAYQVSGLAVDPQILLQGGWFYSPPGSGLQYPNTDASGSWVGYFGPNFNATSAVPEPGAVILLLTVFALIGVLVRRKHQASH